VYSVAGSSGKINANNEIFGNFDHPAMAYKGVMILFILFIIKFESNVYFMNSFSLLDLDCTLLQGKILGSVVVDISNSRLDAKFLDNLGNVVDGYSIVKS
jgi:hypothetical protein